MPAEGGYWVYGRGCTEPGGGIVPSWGFVPNRTNGALRRNGRSVVGFGYTGDLAAPERERHEGAPSIKTSTPWVEVIASSVIGVATGWVIEEVVRMIRGRKR